MTIRKNQSKSRRITRGGQRGRTSVSKSTRQKVPPIPDDDKALVNVVKRYKPAFDNYVNYYRSSQAIDLEQTEFNRLERENENLHDENKKMEKELDKLREELEKEGGDEEKLKEVALEQNKKFALSTFVAGLFGALFGVTYWYSAKYGKPSGDERSIHEVWKNEVKFVNEYLTANGIPMVMEGTGETLPEHRFGDPLDDDWYIEKSSLN